MIVIRYNNKKLILPLRKAETYLRMLLQEVEKGRLYHIVVTSDKIPQNKVLTRINSLRSKIGGY